MANATPSRIRTATLFSMITHTRTPSVDYRQTPQRCAGRASVRFNYQATRGDATVRPPSDFDVEIAMLASHIGSTSGAFRDRGVVRCER